MGDVPFLEVKNLKKSFGNHEVLKDISLSVKQGEVISIIGSSGSGKSTILRCINLLEEPSGGDIIIEGKSILNDDARKKEMRKVVGMVFQSFNLFENMNVLKNCMIGQIKVLKRNKDEAKEIALKNLKSVGMDAYINDADFLLEEEPQYGGFRPRRTFRGFRYQRGYSDHLPLVVRFRQSR